MTTKGGSHEPERPSALPAQAATFDSGSLRAIARPADTSPR